LLEEKKGLGKTILANLREFSEFRLPPGLFGKSLEDANVHSDILPHREISKQSIFLSSGVLECAPNFLLRQSW